jgi:predicted dehydrogenase
MSSDRRDGVVIIGAGLMGHWHAHAVRAVGGRVAAVVDVDAARAAALARPYRARATTDLAIALEAAPLAVHVCTVPEPHWEIASAAIAVGAHALVEKPFATTAAIAQRILDLAAANRLIVCPVHQFLFQRGVRRAIAELPSFGPLLHADFVACSAGAEDASERSARLALDILPHPLSLIRRLLAAPLANIEWHAASSAPGEVRVSGASRGASVGILISASGRPTRNTVRLVGERGTMHIDLFHGFATFEPPAVSRSRKITRPFRVGAATLAGAGANLARRILAREPAYPGLRDLVAAFYGAIAAAAPSPITFEETMDVAEATDRLTALLAVR